mmetsp:Transcript_83534/g.147241  ORF Transcript_83534/g.147241 Transcript_83534/m.147241 type:complete len:112 (-) Transcript_83534:125-460(-)
MRQGPRARVRHFHACTPIPNVHTHLNRRTRPAVPAPPPRGSRYTKQSRGSTEHARANPTIHHTRWEERTQGTAYPPTWYPLTPGPASALPPPPPPPPSRGGGGGGGGYPKL